MRLPQPALLGSAIITLAVASLTSPAAQGAAIGYWRMEESSATSGGAITSAANSISGVGMPGAATPIAGSIVSYNTNVAASQIYDPISGTTYANQYSALFSGNVASALKASDATAFSTYNNAFTVEFFTKVTDASDTAGATFSTAKGTTTPGNKLALRAYSPATRWYLSTGPGQNLQFNVTTDTSQSVTTTAAVTDGAWHHIAVTVSQNGTSGTAAVYVDGVSSGTINFNGSIGTGSFAFGPGDGNPNPVNYRIDEVRYSSGILAPSQFLQAVPEPMSLGILSLAAGLLLARKSKEK